MSSANDPSPKPISGGDVAIRREMTDGRGAAPRSRIHPSAAMTMLTLNRSFLLGCGYEHGSVHPYICFDYKDGPCPLPLFCPTSKFLNSLHPI